MSLSNKVESWNGSILSSTVSNVTSGTTGTYSNLYPYPYTTSDCTIEIPSSDWTNIGVNLDGNSVSIDGEPLYEYINNLVNKVDKIKDEIKKENNDMKMLNLDFGPAGDAIALSMRGMAVRNETGKYVIYDFDNDEIVDVDPFTVNTKTSLFYKMPVSVKDVEMGDVIIHNKHYCFVIDTSDGTTLDVVDITNGTRQVIYPTKSPFGFNFVTKIISLVDYKNASADSPFGNMLPFILMQDGKMDDMLPFVLMNGGLKDMDPMMLMCLMGSDKNENFLPFIMMAQNLKK